MTGNDVTTATAHDTGRTVTVIGLGNLGRALARTFLQAGHRTTVWNRSPGKAEGLVAAGAVQAVTVGQAVTASDLVIVCVLDHETVRQVLDPAAGALAGRVVVNVTSGTPQSARELDAWVTGQGAAYLSGAVYGVPETIGTPETFALYSGPSDAFDAHSALLELLGASTFVGTDAALASVYDIALLGGMYGMFAGFFHAVALADSFGIKAEELTGLLLRWLTGVAGTLPVFAREIDSRDYVTETSNLSINAAGLANILGASRAQGVSPDLLAPLHDLFTQQIDEGHAAASLSRAIESLRTTSRTA
ncbi:NAD(P)-dependent oxidoreductase [Streptomyces sp. NRRL S-118]|uniref:NAD(P)-dependent oxidoreductase n=1 Tax=Streptomyces sp. NRRL S-118 TaxID=1463881 RepID=UPI0004C4BE9E|nr:NAD(P)-binding domain-containing protein [Streptomyces sp. NRRL S-118]